ncbi:MAG: RES family NAD+ phosphorylase [Vicinamibacterales bacterium]
MTRLGEHPPPPRDLPTRTPLFHESSGPWLRVCRTGRDALQFSTGPVSRFNAPTREFGVLYVAEDLGGAFIETFGRQLDVRSVTSTALSGRAAWHVESEQDLRFVDLASPGGLARLGADNRLTSGEFTSAQSWARALWQHPAQPDGIYYRLRHDPARCGCAVFDRAGSHLRASSLGTLWDPSRRRELGRLLDEFGFALIVE